MTVTHTPWREWAQATADEAPPYAVLDRQALLANAADLTRWSG